MQYKVGTMIEIPRAALTADEIAKEAEFFSFGTNDLTQMTFGFSRDDAGKFLGAYYDKKIYENDPFAKLDQVGVGKLIEDGVSSWAARPARTSSCGICGEHGGDPSIRRVLPQDRPELCFLLSVPRADRTSWQQHRQLSRKASNYGSFGSVSCFYAGDASFYACVYRFTSKKENVYEFNRSTK